MNKPHPVILIFFMIALIGAGDPGAGAVRYGEQLETEPTELEAVALKALEELLPGYGGEPLVMDSRLVVAARDLARLVADNKISNVSEIKSELLNRTLRERGIYDNRSLNTFTRILNEKDIRPNIAATLVGVTGSKDYTHMGAGVAEAKTGEKILAIILVERRVEIEPFPQTISEPGTLPVKGQTVGRGEMMKVSLLLTPPSGEVISQVVEQNDRYFKANVPFTRGPGNYIVEIVLTGEGRAFIAALMNVELKGANTKASAVYSVAPRKQNYSTAEQAERAMIDMVNEVRTRAGLPALRAHPVLTELARSHSRDMMLNDFFSHYSPAHGDSRTRANDAGLYGYPVAENIAVNPDLTEAMNNLLQSPAHREPIFDKNFSRIGVGIVIDDRGGIKQFYITQEFSDIKD